MMVKICGITNRDDALAAVEGGAAALGFNFWPGSPRHIAVDAAAQIVETLPANVWKVGLFVDEAPEAIRAITEQLALDVAQIHGDGGWPEGIRIWKALAVTPEFHPQDLDAYAVEAFLLDAPAGVRRGGAGKPFDWRLAAGASKRIVLAGGLDASNVAEAIRTARPWGVDACSRLESAPGKKDHDKMSAFLKAAREAG
ncbi:MAG: phosphoribosylanthranilate isomerase [Bryobacteraceae bacterium]|nr:phosphoribosylanthranilate isomerase [Bryobacteraceae bacterium]